jgi:chromosome segregation ATPase
MPNDDLNPDRSENVGSLDFQIREAKRRAEDFSRSLQNSRKEEDESMRLVEEERRRWAVSYEEKTVMIEQLQRELAVTVEALNMERGSDRKASLKGVESSAPPAPPRSRNNLNTTFQKTTTNNFLTGRGSAAHHTREVPVTIDYAERYHQASAEINSLKQQLASCHLVEGNLKNDVAHLNVELEHAKNAWRDSEGKLQFRSNQVLLMRSTVYPFHCVG